MVQAKTVTCVVHDKGTVGDGVPASYSPSLVAGLEYLQPVLTPLHTSPNNTINNSNDNTFTKSIIQNRKHVKPETIDYNDGSSTDDLGSPV